ncbi:hypothetical protein BWI93_24995 [Siphonobacter sp. BAB-5385]|uniref:hypothetical protein n=1 Tax=Siphonobacter sp. BAB-5385 TaxID=1864822 RepID=UPI000B9E0A29|nr:hypothetical protein [Siphonobacter sp. BAB-5385]OZI05525.1 hypothetical protein BWI93_24995 [Siphonobacter sp. BAB-5385]
MKVNSGLYDRLYRKVFRKYSIEEYGKEYPIKFPKIWTTQIDAHNSAKYDHRVIELFEVESPRYLYTKYLDSKKYPEIEFQDQSLSKMIEYLGFKAQAYLNYDTKAKRLLNDFEASLKEELASLEHNTRVPKKLRHIIEHLMEGTWWFCFRGHRVAADSINSWTLVYNVMEFKQTVDQKISVSKIKRNQKERYKDTFGFIDFDASTSRTLAINLFSESLKEHCHIKLNIELHGDKTKKELFLGEYIQHEYDGHISSGSAILINTKARLDADEESELIEHIPGHFSIPINADFNNLNIATPFKHIAFYFHDKNLNSRRTTNHLIFQISELLEWKRKRSE